MSKKTVETTASGLAQFTGMKNLSPLDTEEVTELGQYFNKSSGGGGEGFEPTEAQLAAMNSGITSTKVATYDALPNEDDVKDIISDHFVAGTNVTITDNADGTQTIASTASGGTSDYSDLTNKPTINNVTLSGNKTTADLGISEVPPFTPGPAGDEGKVLTVDGTTASGLGWTTIPKELPTYGIIDEGKALTVSSYGDLAWATPATPAPLKGDYIIPNNQGERIDHIYYGSPANVGLTDTFVLYTETNQVQTDGMRLAAAIGSNHKLYFKFKPYNESYGNWIALDIDALSNYSAAPTAYTVPTYDTTYVDTTSSSTYGGYVVINNICYVNIHVKMKSIPSSTSTYTTIATGLPKPLNASVKVHVETGETGPGFAQIGRSNSSLVYKKGSDSNAGNPRDFSVSYLIDTST
jgi:hypothetical protein